MAFNFGAFVGGFSEQLVKDLEAEEERKFEMEKIAETEAMRQRAAASSRRRSEQLATEQMMNALSMFYSPDNAARIALGGQAVADQYLSWGATAAENGKDPNALVQFSGGSNDVTDQQTLDDMAVLAAPRAPEAEITTSADALEPTQTIGVGAFTPNVTALGALFAEPEPTANSLGELFTQNLVKRINLAIENPNSPELETLMAREEEILAASESWSATQRDSNGETRFFDNTQLETITNSLLRQAYTRNGFRTDLEGQILDSLEGNEHRQYLAEMQAAQALEEDYSTRYNDPILTARVSRMIREATDGFIEYGNSIRYATSSQRLKDSVDPVTFNTRLNEGRYRVGDVIPVQTADGTTRFVVYTGFPMPTNTDAEGRPYDFLFLN